MNLENEPHHVRMERLAADLHQLLGPGYGTGGPELRFYTIIPLGPPDIDVIGPFPDGATASLAGVEHNKQTGPKDGRCYFVLPEDSLRELQAAITRVLGQQK